ncbi:hypothetical protein FN846DRAFT_510912 [Sphaerosporella brunnea]|uniref:Uncharacterized protein n=1 Tax=Sphaerosporella brunnea TaxID=1250544 RepID=A0A5J5F3I4_9PEZI|nr:hypothetical protein FN846DRAFT_510912 [Sphaerosporella brunnea]
MSSWMMLLLLMMMMMSSWIQEPTYADSVKAARLRLPFDSNEKMDTHPQRGPEPGTRRSIVGTCAIHCSRMLRVDEYFRYISSEYLVSRWELVKQTCRFQLSKVDEGQGQVLSLLLLLLLLLFSGHREIQRRRRVRTRAVQKPGMLCHDLARHGNSELPVPSDIQ